MADVNTPTYVINYQILGWTSGLDPLFGNGNIDGSAHGNLFIGHMPNYKPDGPERELANYMQLIKRWSFKHRPDMARLDVTRYDPLELWLNEMPMEMMYRGYSEYCSYVAEYRAEEVPLFLNWLNDYQPSFYFLRHKLIRIQNPEPELTLWLTYASLLWEGLIINNARSLLPFVNYSGRCLSTNNFLVLHALPSFYPCGFCQGHMVWYQPDTQQSIVTTAIATPQTQ